MTYEELQHLYKLIDGDIQPSTGMEKHFMKVIKGDAQPCTPLEKVWYEKWENYISIERMRYCEQYSYYEENQDVASDMDTTDTSDSMDEIYQEQDDLARSDEEGWYYED